jgi:hypothetical protein
MAIRLPSGDLYAELGVAPDASADEISTAFRARARELHPDSNPDPEALERFKHLSVAYRVLGDAQERARYDEQRRARLAPAQPVRPSAAPVAATTTTPVAPATPQPTLFGWEMTRRRAGWILGAGIACLVLSGAVTVWVLADPASGDDSARTITLALVAAKLFVGGLVAVVLGSRRLAHTPR